jgi:hypothetical protein
MQLRFVVRSALYAAALVGAAACSSGEPHPAPILTFALHEGDGVSELMLYPDGEFAAWSSNPAAQAKGTLSSEELATLRQGMRRDVASNDPTAQATELRYEVSLTLEDGMRCDGRWTTDSSVPTDTQRLFGQLETILAGALSGS